MSIGELFGAGSASAANARTLSGTAELTAKASNFATHIITEMEANIENYRERIALSAKDGNELDKLIDELIPYADGDADFLAEIDEATIDNMLKSQQSKRSRSKSKAMTLDNYRTLMTAAVAEYIIRKVTGKAKTAGGPRRGGIVDFTPAQLEELEADQERLKKEIRNIQSKKSIMKSKEGFDESSDAWQALLRAEVMLKDLRVGGRSNVIEVDRTKDALSELLGDVDPDQLKAADAKELLARIMELKQ